MIDGLLEKGLSPHFLAKDAVGKAMMVAQASLLESYGKGYSQVTLQEALQGHCSTGSAIALDYLTTYMQPPNQIFTHGCIINSEYDAYDPFKGRYLHDKWFFFLVKDTEDCWHAACPGNYDPADPHTLLLTPVPSSKDLSKVIAALRKKMGGRWPNEDVILDATVRNAQYVHPKRIEDEFFNLPTLSSLTISAGSGAFEDQFSLYTDEDVRRERERQNQRIFSIFGDVQSLIDEAHRLGLPLPERFSKQ